jgi:hypothetical protein
MALLFFDGFDDIVSTNPQNYILNHKFSGGATLNFINGSLARQTGKFGSGYGIDCSTTGGAAKLNISLLSPASTVIVAFDLYPKLGLFNPGIFFPRGVGDTGMFTVSLYQFTGLQIKNSSGTQVAVARNVLRVNDWNWLSIKYVVSSTAGLIEVRDAYGNVIVSYSGNTRGSATTDEIERIALIDAGTVGASFWIDNLYILDNSGPAPWNDHLTEMRTFKLVPNAAGDLTEWSPNGAANVYQCVDDPEGNDDTDYASSDTTGQRFLVHCTDLTRNETNYYGVVVKNRVRRDDSGLWSLDAAIKTGGTIYYSGARDVSNSAVYVNLSEFWAKNPSTSADWTFADINALQIGARSTLA